MCAFPSLGTDFRALTCASPSATLSVCAPGTATLFTPSTISSLPATVRPPTAPIGRPGCWTMDRSRSIGPRSGRFAAATSCLSSCLTRLECMAIVVTVPITATTTAISATADTTSRVRSDQRRCADTVTPRA